MSVRDMKNFPKKVLTALLYLFSFLATIFFEEINLNNIQVKYTLFSYLFHQTELVIFYIIFAFGNASFVQTSLCEHGGKNAKITLFLS